MWSGWHPIRHRHAHTARLRLRRAQLALQPRAPARRLLARVLQQLTQPPRLLGLLVQLHVRRALVRDDQLARALQRGVALPRRPAPRPAPPSQPRPTAAAAAAAEASATTHPHTPPLGPWGAC
jgi:hypothetical protein